MRRATVGFMSERHGVTAEADLQGLAAAGPSRTVSMMMPERPLSCAKGRPQLFYAECEMDHIWPDWNRGMMASTGRRKPISMSGAGKAVCGILR
jgi:hypothetical protein